MGPAKRGEIKDAKVCFGNHANICGVDKYVSSCLTLLICHFIIERKQALEPVFRTKLLLLLPNCNGLGEKYLGTG